ncbi:prostatic acid phosphatase-like [Watersipora subatra]|uniref:prostatic acid phosphatase-like n=1 Tax=Watersipora subatra TaxID=2589382 RepID=UPI00355C3725
MYTSWLAFLLTFLLSESSSKELIQVNLVFRHGDRSPIEIYPNDPHQANEWPEGLGMLTQIGREQQTRLGKYLRQRYSNLTSRIFNSNEIYIRSSDTDRTLMSVYSNLAGLYNTSVEWDGRYISWQPLPVHTVPAEMDELLKMSRPCPRYGKLRKKVTSPAMEKLAADYSQLIQLVLRLTGYKEDDAKTFTLLSHIRDDLFCKAAHNISWPEWANWRNSTCATGTDIACFNKTIFEILSDIHVYDFYNQTVNSPLLHKFIGGPLVVEILDNIFRKLDDMINTPQLYIYSAHDHTVAAFLAALGAYNTMMPEYTATVMLEIYRVDDNDHVVEAYYKNITDSNITYTLNISGCPQPCGLTTFNNLFSSYRIDWDEACRDVIGFTKNELEVMAFCLTFICLLGVVALVCLARRRRKYHHYARVET